MSVKIVSLDFILDVVSVRFRVLNPIKPHVSSVEAESREFV